MSTPSKNTQKALSRTPIETAFNALTASRAEMEDQEDHATRARQTQLEYEQTNASASASFEHPAETLEELPRTPPTRYLTAARAQAEFSYNDTTHPSQPERSSTASQAESTSYEEHAARARQTEHLYSQENTSANAPFENLQETVSHPPHRPSHRDPDEYLQMFARASELLPELYCTCRGPETDEMVHCSSEENCPVGWYHAACVGMKVLPGPNKDWFCPHCRQHGIGKPAVAEGRLPTIRTRRNQRMWSQEERNALQRVMGELSAQGGVKGLKGFEEVAKRLTKEGFEKRSAASVKGLWNRNGAAGGDGAGGAVAGAAGVSETAKGKMRAVEEDEGVDEEGGEAMEEDDVEGE